MNVEAIQGAQLAPLRTSVTAKMLNIFVSPTQAFEEVIAGPAKTINWMVPMVLVCLSSLFMIELTTSPEQTTGIVHKCSKPGD